MEDPKQNLRTNIALMLILAVTMGFMLWNGGLRAPSSTVHDGGQVAAEKPAPAAPTEALLPKAEIPSARAPSEGVAERRVVMDRPEVRYEFSSIGGGLVRAELHGPKMREQIKISMADGFRRLLGGKIAKAPQMDVAVPVVNEPLPLAVAIQDEKGGTLFPANTHYQVESLEDGISFTAKEGALQIVKRFSWPKEGFEMRYDLSIQNVSEKPVRGQYALTYARAVDPQYEEAPSFFGGVGNQSRAACRVNESLETLLPKHEQAEQKELQGKVNFVGIDQQYFLSALYPLKGPMDGRCVLKAGPSARLAQAYFQFDLPPGQAVTEAFGAFLGPKDVSLLAAAPTAYISKDPPSVSPGLEKTVNFGIWAVICKVLLLTLKFFHGLTKSWGVAVVLLTLAVKVLLLPLTHKSMVAAEDMKKLQPQMEQIRKKYADDRERQSMEMMKLYQKAKVNPLGGCLPLLVQMPVWIALFTTLRNSYELYQEPFMAPFITDLTFKDPTYLLPVLLGVTMVVTQMLQPQMMDPAQAKVMTWVMPIFFTAIMMNYPAGLTLYIFTNNVLSIVQQWGLRRYLQGRGIASPQPAK